VTQTKQPPINPERFSIEFKRHVAQEFLAGETLHGLAKRHDICCNLIRVWVQKYEAGDFERSRCDLLQQYESRIAALERLVGRQALELELLKWTVEAHPAYWRREVRSEPKQRFSHLLGHMGLRLIQYFSPRL
jgi:transposase